MRSLAYVIFVCAVLVPTSSFAVTLISVVYITEEKDPQSIDDFEPLSGSLVQFICKDEFRFDKKTDQEGEFSFSAPSGPCSIRVTIDEDEEIYSTVESVYFEDRSSWLYLYLQLEGNQWFLTGYVE